MPITDLVLRGISRAVSDVNTPDGSTAELINAVVENNEIRPISAPIPLNITIPGDLLAIQVIEGGKKVFISAASQGGTSQNTTWIFFTDEEGFEIATHTIVGRYSGLKATVMDNVVVVSAAFGMYYFLYRDGVYENLGQRPPFPKLMFTLESKGLIARVKEVVLTESVPVGENDTRVISDDSLRQLYASASARIEKFIAGERKDGYFVFPFFVRYALRLFDGSGHILHSAPILMNPSSDKVPFSVPCSLNKRNTGNYTWEWTMGFRGTSAKLQYHSMMSDEDIANLAKWKDLVTHVDIFVSAPIYSNKEITADYRPTWEELDGGYGLSESQYRRQINTANYGYYSGQEGLERAVIGDTLFPEDTPPEWEMVIPAYTQEEQYDVVKSTSQFYLLSSIPIEELTTLNESSWEDVAIEEGTLDVLVNRPVLKDDFNSHVAKRSSVMEVYNDRLILAGMGYTPYGGYPLSTMRPYINRELYGDPVQSATTLRKGRDIITVQSQNERLSNVNKPQISWWPQGFYYYPDASAKEITIPTMFDDNADTIRGYKTYELTPHNSLNGAYLFLGYPEWDPGRPPRLPISGNDLPQPSFTTSYSAPSEVYQSVVGNPFVFPLEGITSIGKAPLIALTASTIEVSSGQFGDFPMYAFAEDGVWVLSIDKEGWISAPQLISNDVCLGESMVAALNRPVVFGSKRGLMLIEGSKVSCLSDNLLGPRSEATDLTSIDETECFNTLDSAYSHESFIDFMSKPYAALAYDYAHNRIYITNPGAFYCYVLSLQSLEFSKMALSSYINIVIPHYSGVYLATSGWGANSGVSGVSKISTEVDTDGSSTRTPVVVVTRPIKFGTVGLKTIKHLLTRHNCEKGVGVLLYGSRDEGGYGSYRLITSLRGRSYKYFVLALYAPEMAPQERISCVSFDWEPRFSNKFR